LTAAPKGDSFHAGARRPFPARRALGRVRAALARRWRRQTRKGSNPAGQYRGRLRKPIDPDLAVFAAYWYRGYSCNPRAIYEQAREIVPGMHGVWVVKKAFKDTMPPGVEHVIAGTPEYYDLIARARYFVNNVNFPNNLVKREGAVHVMTHHGTPLKRMGLDLRDVPDGEAKMDFDKLLRRSARWDYSVAQNAFSTAIWERAFPVPFESLEVGYPRNDRLATATADDVERIRAELGIEPGRRVILYAPTRREYKPDYTPFPDIAALSGGLGDDWTVLARIHYLDGADPRLADLQERGRIRDVTTHPSVEELCIAADLLITDYSSIMFDYAVLDRPIVIHAPDWDEYRVRRGTYFDLMAERPGVVTSARPQLVEAIVSGEFAGDDARHARAAFRDRFCSLDDGHAAERVVRRVWATDSEAVTHPTPASAT
jgi:CDP-glycerol glycerophosphotransferase